MIPKWTLIVLVVAVAMTAPVQAIDSWRLDTRVVPTYPFAKLDLLAVPEYLYGAMENAGAVTFRDEYLLLDPETAGAAEHRSLVSIMAHDLAHMWFGDLLTVVWWDDLWLNESIASFAGDQISQQLFPEYQFDLSQKRSANWAMSTDALPSTVAIRHEVNSESDIFRDLGLAYSKGQAVLEMIDSWMGHESFRRGVVQSLDKYAWKNATGSDFWRVIARVAEVDVESVLSSYLDQPGLPLLEGEVTPSGQLRLQQSRLLNFGFEGPDETWTVPVTLRYSADGKPSPGGWQRLTWPIQPMLIHRLEQFPSGSRRSAVIALCLKPIWRSSRPQPCRKRKRITCSLSVDFEIPCCRERFWI